MSAHVDVVVVSYNSADRLRACVEPLAREPALHVVVIDNASQDDSPAVVSDLAVEVIPLDENRGFGGGCNVGWRSGEAPFVLFLNPDAEIVAEAVLRLADALERTGAGAVAPRIVHPSGSLEPSLRRFPEVRSIYGQALFAHRLFPAAAWADEVIRDPARYEREAPCDWASGACLLVRRELLERLDGFDEGFFMYREDVDLCRRLWHDGNPVVYVPDVRCTHAGGASAPRWRLRRVLVESRIRYAVKHFGRGRAGAYRLGIVLYELTHLLLGDGLRGRLGHASGLLAGLGMQRARASRRPRHTPPAGAAQAPRSYALVTPVRSEEENLQRLAVSLAAQTLPPARWVIVDNGSEDGTLALAHELARNRDGVTVISVPGEARAVPGAPIVRAFHAGLRALGELPDVVVKLDADTSMERDHFERLLEAFAADPTLGIASGTCLEQNGSGSWEPVPVTLGHVRGAVRAYRRECLQQVLPLEERVGWDGIDGWKAAVRGWTTRMLPELGFYHHRPLGARDGAPTSRYRTQGEAAWFLGYRLSYLLLRTLYRARRDRAAVAMVGGYLSAALRREPRYADPEVRAYVRRGQSFRSLTARAFGS